jgi:hypothetical protein
MFMEATGSGGYDGAVDQESGLMLASSEKNKIDADLLRLKLRSRKRLSDASAPCLVVAILLIAGGCLALYILV